MVTNHQVLFNKVAPTGLPKPGETTTRGSAELDLDTVPLNGGVLTRNIAVSLDPTMRNRMKGNIGYFSPPYVVGQPVTAIGIGEVVRSEADGFAAGDIVYAWSIGIEEYTIHPASAVPTFRKFDAKQLENGLSITTYLGAAGMAGMTAYMSLKEIIGDLKPGNKMFVSGAAGAVGQLVVQLCHQAGVRVIASAAPTRSASLFDRSAPTSRSTTRPKTSPPNSRPSPAKRAFTTTTTTSAATSSRRTSTTPRATASS